MSEMLKRVAMFAADGSACGSADPKETPASACGAADPAPSACGAADPAPSACGSACGAADPDKK